MTVRSRALHLFAAAIAAGATAAASGQATLPAPAPVTPTVAAKPALPAAVPAFSPAAAKPTANSLWKQLTLPQQVALDPLKGEWDHMDTLRRQKWLEIANRYASMKPDEQLRVQERMRAWLKLTPEERRVARENYTLSKKIGKDQKTAQWEQYQQLPEEEKRKLAADAASKKQITNLPPKTQPKAVAPIKPAAPCPAGTVKNANAAVPACIAIPASVPAAVPGAAPTPAPVNPAIPVPNVK